MNIVVNKEATNLLLPWEPNIIFHSMFKDLSIKQTDLLFKIKVVIPITISWYTV